MQTKILDLQQEALSLQSKNVKEGIIKELSVTISNVHKV